MTYPLAALSVALASIPLLFAWRVVKAPIRIWVPLLFFPRADCAETGRQLIGPEGMTGLIYILAGAAKN
jgi:hypothetical protein